MEITKALELLKQRLDEILKLRALPPDKKHYKLWCAEVCNILELAFGKSSREYDNFARAVRVDYLVSTNEEKRKKYNEELDAYETALRSAIHKCELLGVEEKPTVIAGLPPKAFIAHEGETRALTILKEFLEVLGIKYFIAEVTASGGRSVERQVDWTQSKADFAICLATKGKAINKKTGKHFMAPNIADELGRARQVFGNKIILLVQKGVEPHTNIREIVYEDFTTTNMEKAFIKIAKELTNWGFITAETIKERTP